MTMAALDDTLSAGLEGAGLKRRKLMSYNIESLGFTQLRQDWDHRTAS